MNLLKKREVAPENMIRQRSQLSDIWVRLCENKLAIVGMVIVILLIFMAIFADFLAGLSRIFVMKS